MTLSEQYSEVDRYKQFYIHGGISGHALALRIGVKFSDIKPILDKWDTEHEEG